MNKKLLSQERLSILFSYSEETGLFTRKLTQGNKIAGTIAGTPDKDGYIKIKIDGMPYLAHRLAFLYMTGEFPKDQVDHRNGISGDNKWANLREASNLQNAYNRIRIGASGVKGVRFNKSAKKWEARIAADGTRRYLGVFDTKEQAHQVYCEAANQLHKEFFAKDRHESP